MTYRSIADRLNQDGIKTKKGGIWQPGTIRNIITNPAYAGYVSRDSVHYLGAHKPIIPLELWESINGRMDDRRAG